MEGFCHFDLAINEKTYNVAAIYPNKIRQEMLYYPHRSHQINVDYSWKEDFQEGLVMRFFLIQNMIFYLPFDVGFFEI